MSDDIRTRPATQEYRDGWERTFGKRKQRDEDERGVGPHHGFHDRDGNYHPAPGRNAVIERVEP